MPGSATGSTNVPGVGDPGGSGVWSNLGKFLKKGTSSLDDALAPVGKVMNALDVLGLNKPLSKPAPLKSRVQLEQPQVPMLDPNAQRLAIMQAFNLQG